MLELITVALSLANTLMTFIQDQELLKYVNQMKDIQEQLISERAKGFNSDDAKIEALYGQFHVIASAFQNQLSVLKPVPAK